MPGNPPLYSIKNINNGKKINALYPAEQLLILGEDDLRELGIH